MIYTKNNMETIQLNFEGYWREMNKNGTPQYCGIYVVYRCVYNDVLDTVSLKEILYIGKSDDIHNRLTTHDKIELFKNKVQSGEELCYSCAKVNISILDAVENALIYAQKPVLNKQGKEIYEYQPLHIVIDGACSLMKHTNFNIR